MHLLERQRADEWVQLFKPACVIADRPLLLVFLQIRLRHPEIRRVTDYRT
jgi:hypothetical protein